MKKTSEKIAYISLLLITAIVWIGALFVTLYFSANQQILSNGLRVTIPTILDLGLSFSIDGFRIVYGFVVTFMWFMTTLLSKDYFNGHHQLTRYFIFTIITLFATLGVFFADDLFTSFVFFEIMSIASFVWVVQEETDGAIKAANTYLAVAVIGGLTALMGVFMLQNEFHTTRISALYECAVSNGKQSTLYVAGALILVGYGAKAGMFPLHIWLPEAHPVAPAPASSLLSGVLTKSGIVGVLVLSCNLFRYDANWGIVILLLGTVTMFLGAVLALFSVNLKRTLACSSMSQIGFILVGIGMMGILGEENALAARGTLHHMMNHSLFKLVLFLCAGVVYMNAHTLDLNELRGFGRKKPVLMICFLLGALGIGGIPGFSGYVSKTLLHEAIVEGKELLPGVLTVIEWIFLLSGGLTLGYMTKLFVCLFIEHGPKEECHHHNDSFISKIAIAVPAIIIPILGCTPNWTMDAIASFGTDFFHAGELEEKILYFSWNNLKGALVSIAFGSIFYFGVVRTWMMKDRLYINRWPEKLSLENLIYRPMLLKVLPAVSGFFAGVFGENKILTIIYSKVVMPVLGFVAKIFGENKVLTVICKKGLRTIGILFHVLADSLDAVILLLRKTIFKPADVGFYDKVSHDLSFRVGHVIDQAVHHEKEESIQEKNRYGSLFYRLTHTFETESHQLADTLSFALLMLAFAIVLIFLYVLFLH